MCKTKPNIFHTTSLNKDLHHPNIPNMWRGPTDLPTDLRVRLELRSTFWNHEHTLTISYLASSIARFWRWKHSALDTLGGTRKKQPKRKVQKYQSYSQILQILTQSNMSSRQAKKSSILIGSIQKLTVFSTNNLHGLCPDLIFRRPFCSFR